MQSEGQSALAGSTNPVLTLTCANFAAGARSQTLCKEPVQSTSLSPVNLLFLLLTLPKEVAKT